MVSMLEFKEQQEQTLTQIGRNMHCNGVH
jgi:hypothetical protein